MPAKISSNGWASTITPRMARTTPTQTLARFSSWRITGSRNSDRAGLLGLFAGVRIDRALRRCDRHCPGAPCGGGALAGWSEVPARPPRSAVNQLIGFQ